MPSIHHAPLTAIAPTTLYKILALRTAVFVQEQGITCEPELDGRDLEPTTELFWAEEDGAVLATLRLLADGPTAHLGSVAHLGRVATASAARGRGLAGRLIEDALAKYPGAVEISAQARLEAWYGGFGFTRIGPNYLEAGLDHVPMRRDPALA